MCDTGTPYGYRVYPTRVFRPIFRRMHVQPARIAIEALARPGADRHRPVRRHHGHVDHRSSSPRHPARARIHTRIALVGLQRLRRRLRWPAAAGRPPLRHLRRAEDLRAGLAGPDRRLGARRRRHEHRDGDHGPRHPGRRLRDDRARGTHAAHDAVRRHLRPAEGLRRLRRGRTDRRHGRRLPRRRPDRVRQLALGLLRHRPDRTLRAGIHRHGASSHNAEGRRIDRHLGRSHRDRRTCRRGLRGGQRPRGRLAHLVDAGAPGGRHRAPGRLLRHPGPQSEPAPAPRPSARTAPRRGEQRSAPAGCGMGVDVVLPQPLSPAGPRSERIRGRRRSSP